MMEAAFEARLQLAKPFLAGLRSMREISTMATLIVRAGEIELRICNDSCTSLASLVLQAKTTFPLSDGIFALRLDVVALATELSNFLEFLDWCEPNVGLLVYRPICIFKAHNSDTILFQIESKHVFHHHRPVSRAHLELNLRDLKFLSPTITLDPECFRVLMGLFDPGPVEIYFVDGTVTWRQPSKGVQVIFDNSIRCRISGGLETEYGRLTVDFLKREPLLQACHVSRSVRICALDSDNFRSWIVVKFVISESENDYMVHLVRGLIHREVQNN